MDKTIAAIATGNSVGGIGVIRISGDKAIETAEKVFAPFDGSKLSELGGYRAKYGQIIYNGEKTDNAVALVFRAPKSYTGEDVVELSVHGGLYIVEKTLEAVLGAGAVPAEAGEFTKRAFLNGKIDLAQAESVADLISAQGETAAKASYNMLQGSLSKKINEILDMLTDCSAALAAWVDYPDEEIPDMSDVELLETLKKAADALEDLVDGYENGIAAVQGTDAVIAGRPNAGKSTFMNLLAGREKSIVTKTEGTTRDIVEETVRLGGITLRLSDTAGLRSASDEAEEMGIRRAYEKIDTAPFIFAVFDSSRELNETDSELIEKCGGKKAVAVINKTDLEQRANTREITEKFENCVFISAKNDKSISAVESAVKSALGTARFDAAAPMLANQRQRRCCVNAAKSVREAEESLAAGITRDAVNVLIDDAINELLSLTGKKATEEVVNNIFGRFCVGK